MAKGGRPGLILVFFFGRLKKNTYFCGILIVIGMKKFLIPLAMAALLLAGCASQQERTARRSLVRNAVAEAVAKRAVHIGITAMNTMRYGSRTVSPDFFLELRGDTLRSYLPYLGQVHQAPMTTPSQGLNFEAPVRNYTVNNKRGNVAQMELDVSTREHAYHYRIEVYETGQAYIHVRAQHQDPISFDGHLENL